MARGGQVGQGQSQIEHGRRQRQLQFELVAQLLLLYRAHIDAQQLVRVRGHIDSLSDQHSATVANRTQHTVQVLSGEPETSIQNGQGVRCQKGEGRKGGRSNENAPSQVGDAKPATRLEWEYTAAQKLQKIPAARQLHFRHI